MKDVLKPIKKPCSSCTFVLQTTQTMKKAFIAAVAITICISCKETTPVSEKEIEMNSTEMPENQIYGLDEDGEMSVTQVTPLEPFDGKEVIEYLGFEKLKIGSKLEILKTLPLKKGDSLIAQDIQVEDSTIKTINLKRNGAILLKMVHNSKRIKDILVTDAAAVPDGMLAPGNTLGDLNAIDAKLKPYGSELESRVYVTYKGVEYELDARHPKHEPLNLYPSTKIIAISFK